MNGESFGGEFRAQKGTIKGPVAVLIASMIVLGLLISNVGPWRLSEAVGGRCVFARRNHWLTGARRTGGRALGLPWRLVDVPPEMSVSQTIGTAPGDGG